MMMIADVAMRIFRDSMEALELDKFQILPDWKFYKWKKKKDFLDCYTCLLMYYFDCLVHGICVIKTENKTFVQLITYNLTS